MIEGAEAQLPVVVLPETIEDIVPVVPPEAQANLPPKGRLRKALHAAQYMLRGMVIAAEVSPITNEGSRYGALAASEMLTHNPLMGAAVLGGSTLVVEGASALAASNLLTNETSHRLLDWLNSKMDKIIPRDRHLSKPLQAGVAMVAGVPALMAVQQRHNPDRKAREARRQGLLTSAWMAGVFAVEGAVISEGVSNYTDPKIIGASLLSVAAMAAIPSWAKRALKRDSSKEKLSEPLEEITAIMAGGDLSPEQVKASAARYEAYRDQEDEAVKVGLYGEDLEDALNNPHSILVKYGDKKDAVYMPLLVPAKDLKWYNMQLLKKMHGYGREYYYYAHPSIPEDEHSQAAIKTVLRQKLDRNSVIFTDRYTDRSAPPVFDLTARDVPGMYALENLGGGETRRTGEVFAGPVRFEGVEEIKEAPSISEIYRQALERGELQENPENGVALVETIEGEDAERIWEIYKAPFDALSEEHPMYAGFDKEELMGILQDPSVAKLVNRVDGVISTLCFFVDNFDHCPWFNREYYQKQYPEYYRTGNILIFPGIVTDENMRGNNYALDVGDLAMTLYAKRGSNVLVTFECTETSAIYIPTIMKVAVEHNGAASIEGVEDPFSVTEYQVLTRR